MKEKSVFLKDKNQHTDSDRKLHWLNCAKAAAIIAVLVDHSLGILYTDINIQVASDYDVSLFILSAGITSYISNSYSKLSWGKAYLKSIKKIFLAYLLCSAICLIIKTQGFDIGIFLEQLIHFSATLPLYFVFLYMQLMLVSRLLYRILEKCQRNKVGYIQEFILFAILTCISSYTANYTNILNIYSGGGRVLGGTYLMLFYFGMLMAKHEWFAKESLLKSIIIWSVSSIAWFVLWKNFAKVRWTIDVKVPLGEGYDCPSITLMVFSILTLLSIYGICKILEKTKFTRKIVLIGSWLGEHTLYIFMYHLTLLYFVFMPYIEIENIWVKRIVYMSLMIVIPLVIEYIVNFVIVKVREKINWIKMKCID